MTEPAETSAPLPGPVTMGEFRARLAEMADRVLAGEEIVVLRGTQPVARFVPVESRRPKRLGVMREFLSDEERRALGEALDTPLSNDEQRVLESGGTDELGIWTGLPEDHETSRHR